MVFLYYFSESIIKCEDKEIEDNKKSDEREMNVYVKLIETKKEDGEQIASDYPPFSCPNCHTGKVHVGHIKMVVFPKGALAADQVGEVRLIHYVCDRCSFRVLLDLENADTFQIFERVQNEIEDVDL